MNGHSSAETLAFRVTELGRRYGRSLSHADDAPVFVFAAGVHSGERELASRLPFWIASESTVDPSLLSALAYQFVRVATAVAKGVAVTASDAARERDAEQEAVALGTAHA
ncbi:MAG: hypothetical protein ACREHD_07020, partial [Pirellulales bacterium]